jgi:hypothetical protein
MDFCTAFTDTAPATATAVFPAKLKEGDVNALDGEGPFYFSSQVGAHMPSHLLCFRKQSGNQSLL